MTSRMQITLDDAVQARIKRKADAAGISIAEYVRRAVARELGDEAPKADISEIFGLGTSGEPTDISRNKNRMIADSIAAGKIRR